MTHSAVAREVSAKSYVGASAIFASLGLTSGGWGPVLPWLADKHQLGIGTVGTTLFVLNAGALSGILLTQLLVRTKTIFWFIRLGVLAFAIGFSGIVLAPEFSLVLLAALFAGFGFGVLDVGLIQAITRSDNRTSVKINFSNAVFGIGAILGPLLVAILTAEYLPNIMITTVVIAALSLLLLSGLSWNVEVNNHQIQVVRNKPMLAVFFVGIAFYVGLEVSAGSWLPTLMQERTGSLESGAISGALFYLMFTIGRIVATPLSHKISAERLLLGSVGLAFPVLLLAIVFQSFAPFGIALMGLLIGPVFAAASDWIAVRTPGDPLATTLLLLAAMTGALILPPSAGFLLERFGAEVLPILLAPILLVSIGCFGYMIRHWRQAV
jgi:FHS family glucose/mannose:H+ symporter-like MFS transporter